MVRRIRLRPTYASVTATLALFLALGGGAYAAATLPANSVGAKQIKKGAVERAEIKSNAVDGSKVRDNALTGDDVKESSLAKVPSASAADAATHATASTALDKVTYKSARGSAPANTPSAFATATCDPGQRVAGGGERVDDADFGYVVDSYPDLAGTAWTAHVGTVVSGGTDFTVTAICISAAAVG
jgi:hypothetical protein